MPKHPRLPALFFGLVLALLTSAANATVIAGVSGNTGSSYRVGGPFHQVETMSWFQGAAYADVSIFATIGVLGDTDATVEAYLSDELGSGAGPVLASATIALGAFASTADFTSLRLFDGLDLGVGTYFLTLYSSNETQQIRWARGGDTTFAPSAHTIGEYFAETFTGVPDPAAPWKSLFAASPYYDNAFSVEAAAVPEPRAWAVALLGFGVMGAVLRRRRRAQGGRTSPERLAALLAAPILLLAGAAQGAVMTFSGVTYPYNSATYAEDGIVATSSTGHFSPYQGGVANPYLATITFTVPGRTFDLVSFGVRQRQNPDFGATYYGGGRATGFDLDGNVVATTGHFIGFGTLYSFTTFVNLGRLEITTELGTADSPTESLVIDDIRIEPSLSAGIPEPGAWALMILGIGLAASALRRRRRHLAAP